MAIKNYDKLCEQFANDKRTIKSEQSNNDKMTTKSEQSDNDKKTLKRDKLLRNVFTPWKSILMINPPI